MGNVRLCLVFCLFFLFLSCDSDNPENDIDIVETDDVSVDEEISDTDIASDLDDNETPDVDEEESCCRIINTAIAGDDSGMYVAGHKRDKEHGCGCDYIGFIKKYINRNWENVYEAGGIGGGPALTRQGVWVGNSDEIAVVGVDGPLFFIDDKWGKITDGELNINSIQYDVWGTSLTDIFSVGGDDSPRVGAIFHFDGSEWVRMEIPTENELNRVWGSGSDDVFAVGENGTILHYDGEKWSEMESGTVEYLSDVWGSSKDNVYVVGGSYETQEKGTYLILHYDGEKWKEIDSGTSCVLRRIHGTDGDNVYAVGGLMVDGSMRSEVFHYDGKEWTKSTLNTKHGLYDIHAMPDGSFYVVGDNNTIERITP